MKKWMKMILIFCILGTAYMGGLYLLQNRLLFYPDWRYVSPQQAGLEVFQEISLSAVDGNPIRLWYAKGDSTKPALLFLHGNAGQIATFAPQLNVLVQAGYSVLAMEYRGFAQVPGTIRQKDVFSDAALAFDFLKAQGHPTVVVYGYSFGTAFASGLTSLRKADGLILTSPFYSLTRIVGEKPVPFARYILKDAYPSFQYVQQFTGPLLIVHSKKDRLIPFYHGQDLFDLSPSDKKEIHLLDKEAHHATYFDGANLPFIFHFLQQNFPPSCSQTDCQNK